MRIIHLRCLRQTKEVKKVCTIKTLFLIFYDLLDAFFIKIILLIKQLSFHYLADCCHEFLEIDLAIPIYIYGVENFICIFSDPLVANMAMLA